MKKYITPLSILFSFSALANQSQMNMTQKVMKNIKDKASFNYGLTYLGPSLDSSYQDGATYNRFKTGQDWKGDDNDHKGSIQLYHAFALGYQVSKNVKVSYTYTFQDDLSSNIEYDTYNSDGSVYDTYTRTKGLSYNNQRVNALVTNIYSNKYFFLMANFYYERPTTDSAIDNGMTYGLGAQPTVGFFTSVPKTYFGVSASLERDFYKENSFGYKCGNVICNTVNQTSRISVTPYITYNFSDKLNLNTVFVFDWDQMGNEVKSTEKFNANMDDLIRPMLNYRVNKQIKVSGGLEASLNKPGLDRTALLGKFNLSL